MSHAEAAAKLKTRLVVGNECVEVLEPAPPSWSKFKNDPLTEQVIGAAIEVHRALGPGLLESAYEECLCFELSRLHIPFKRQVPLPVQYKGIKLDCGYRMDIFIPGRLVIEIKSVERLVPIHEAQLLTYLKLGQIPVGLLINFHTEVLKSGLRRLQLPEVENPGNRVSC